MPFSVAPLPARSRRWLRLGAGFCMVLTVAGRAQHPTIDLMPKSRALDRENTRSVAPTRGLIFFPPFPPVLGSALDRSGGNSESFTSAPEILADFVGDCFYPQLSSHVYDGTLRERLRLRVEEYRAAKLAQRHELRAGLAAAEALEPDARRNALAALARRQEPALEQLEKTAEQLRIDLLAPSRNWSEFREWRLRDRERKAFSPLEIAQVMRAYAFFQREMLPGQRHLLREIVADLSMATEATSENAPIRNYLFFSPSPARIILPDTLPDEVAAKIAAYQTKTSQLKKELYDAVYKMDGKMNFGGNPLRALTAKHTKELAEVETLAEEIRVGLTPLALASSSATDLPPALEARVVEIADRLKTLQGETTVRINALGGGLRARRIPIAISARFETNGLRATASPIDPHGITPETAKALEDAREELESITADYGRRLADLFNLSADLRRDIGGVLGTQNLASIDQAISAARQARAIRRDRGAYERYRTAVLAPGLSPRQRRLLFDEAVESLALPLPKGEMQPTRRPNGW